MQQRILSICVRFHCTEQSLGNSPHSSGRDVMLTSGGLLFKCSVTSPHPLQVDSPDPHPFTCVMLYSGASL